MARFERGVVIGERYRLVDEIGRGGMGTVWCAYDEVLERLVAVKLMAGPGEHLREEARSAARLNHPYITSVYDYGDAPPYIVMELLEGDTLARRLASGPIPVPQAKAVAAQVASALAAAHRRGVVHGDVKPGNIVLTTSGAKVVDFGISTRQHSADTPVYGTPRYIAPELYENAPASPASDVYAFGVLLEELGQSELANRCKEADPAARPTMAELAETLGADTDVEPSKPHDPAAPPREPTRVLDSGRTLRIGTKAKRGLAIGAGGIVAVVVGVLLIGAALDQSDRDEPRGSNQPADQAASPEKLKVRVRNSGSTDDNQLAFQLDLANTGDQPVELADVEVRYWFTADGDPEEFEVACDWAELGCEHVRQRVEPAESSTDSADHVLVLTFDEQAGWISPEQSTGEIQNRVNKTDWSALDETNDHSYRNASALATAPSVTAYVDGELRWGTEPS